MAWSGGSFTRANPTWVSDAGNGIGIEAGRHDAQDNDFTTGINQCLNKDGSNAATGNLNLGGYLPTNIGAGTAAAPAICAGNDVNTGIFSPAADQIGIATNGTEKIRIDASGKIGIGTTTPSVALDIQGTATQLYETRFSNDTTGAQLYLRKSRSGTVGTNTIVTVGDQLGGIYFAGANGTGYDAAAAIGGYAETEPGASGDMPGSIRFFTCANNSATLTERVRIDSSGRVGIGVQSPYSNLNVNAAIQIGGSVTATENFHLTGGTGQAGLSIWKGNYGAGTYLAQFHSNGQLNLNTTSNIGGLVNLQLGTSGGVNDVAIATQNATNGNYAAMFKNVAGTQVGRIQVDASATQYVTSSDYRLKNNITPMIHGLDKVMALKPCKWTWKDYGDEGQGFIAHELQEVIPQAVSGKKDAVDANGDPIYQGVDTGFIVATLTNAIQELNAKVDALEARVAALEA